MDYRITVVCRLGRARKGIGVLKMYLSKYFRTCCTEFCGGSWRREIDVAYCVCSLYGRKEVSIGSTVESIIVV